MNSLGLTNETAKSNSDFQNGREEIFNDVSRRMLRKQNENSTDFNLDFPYIDDEGQGVPLTRNLKREISWKFREKQKIIILVKDQNCSQRLR